MQFSSQTPEYVKKGNTLKLLRVLDDLVEYKTQLVWKHTRFYNSPLLTDLRFLRKKLEDMGHSPIPADFHKDQLDALALNSSDLMAMKGSYKGLRLWLWCLTFGSISDNYENFYPIRDFIIPNEHEDYGYVSNLAPPLGADDFRTLYLFSGADNFGSQILNITIGTKYHYMVTLKKYIEENIFKHIGFIDSNTIITVEFTPGVYMSDPFPNQYFVIP